MVDSNPPTILLCKLRKQGYSDEMIDELRKWYDPSEKKGAASF